MADTPRREKVSPEMRREGGWTMLTEADADAIIAALPGLSLSAQPSEPGETE